MTQDKVYIAGGITGYKKAEVERTFDDAKKRLMLCGWREENIVCPLENDLGWEGTWGEHMKADIKLLATCGAIYMIDNWQKSRGASIEHGIAVATGMQVIYQHFPDEYITFLAGGNVERYPNIHNAVRPFDIKSYVQQENEPLLIDRLTLIEYLTGDNAKADSLETSVESSPRKITAIRYNRQKHSNIVTIVFNQFVININAENGAYMNHYGLYNIEMGEVGYYGNIFMVNTNIDWSDEK